MTIFQKYIFNPLATINSICPFILIFLLKQEDGKYLFNIIKQSKVCNYCLNGIIYFLILFCITYFVLFLSKFLETSSQEFEKDNLCFAHDTFIPAYLGFFFVSLSIDDGKFLLMVFIFILIYIFIYQSNAFFYNPLFLLFGFKFYYVLTANKKRILLITRNKDVNNAALYKYDKLHRINDFTFIDLREKKK